MSQKKLFGALACAGVAVGLMGAPAQAQLPEAHREAVQERMGISAMAKYPVLRTKGTKKWNVFVDGFSNTVAISVRKKGASTSYIKRGKASANRLKAKFGKYGKVNVRFKKKGKVRKVLPPECTGTPDKVQRGVWRGVVKFKGERGYTKVNIKRARGVVTKPGVQECELGDGNGDYASLSAFKNVGDKSWSFYADKRVDVPNSRPTFMATVVESVGKVDVVRSLFQRGNSGQFTYSSVEDAQVKPKGYFSGQGTLSGESWTGNLKGKFPGKGRVGLAGNGFLAFMFFPL